MGLPLLGIAIPTYRRPEQLRRCLRSIIHSASAASHPIPIHVADDSIDDTNLGVMRELQAAYPLLVHHRNARNLGIDGNIVNSVNLCQARHVWLMGEDDRMIPEAVPALLAILSRHADPFVYVNYLSADESVSLVLAERSLALQADAEKDADQFLAEDAWSIGFIGACVVEKARWEQVRPDPYLGTYFAHVGVIFESLAGGGRVRLVAKPLVINRVGTTGAFTWKDETFQVLTGWSRMIDRLRRMYPEQVCDRADDSFRRAHGIGSVRSFCYLRADGVLNPASYREHVRGGPYPALGRLAAWWISRAPPALFRAARRVLMGVRRMRNRRLPAEAP